MTAFWTFAREMLRYRWLLLGALLMVLASSLSLGAGMLGAKPVMDAILRDAKGMDRLARDLNHAVETSNIPPVISRWLIIPEGVVTSLPSDPWPTLVWIMSGLGVITIIGGTTNFLQGYLAQTVVNRTVTALRSRAFHSVLRSPLLPLLSRGVSDAISRIVNDTGVLSNGLSILLSKAILQIAKGVVGLLVAVVFDWRVTLVALLIAPVLYQVIRRLGKRIKRASNATLQSQSGLYMAASESIAALRVVKVHAAERFEAARFHRMNKEMLREQNRLRTAKALASPLTEALTVLMLCGMVLLLGRGIIRGEVHPAGFVLSIASLAVAGASLKPLTGIINDIQSSAPAAERLRDLLELEPEAGHPTRQVRRLPRLARHSREIAFENVSLTYEGSSRPALAGVTLTVPFGRRVAIVGGNGSGKTTLLALLPRLFDPDSGRVLVDGIDIREVSVRSLREQIGVVTQEVTLFRGTIRSNIIYNAGEVPHDKVVSAARLARAHDFIAGMSQGYDTPVTEQGLNLSGGQRQRISIARAILRNPSILIMDEATSMIDAESEVHIGQAIAEFGAGRTCLIVAHRQATILSCDHIFVLDGGTLADHGSHEQLLQRCDAYRALWRGQAENS